MNFIDPTLYATSDMGCMNVDGCKATFLGIERSLPPVVCGDEAAVEAEMNALSTDPWPFCACDGRRVDSKVLYRVDSKVPRATVAR